MTSDFGVSNVVEVTSKFKELVLPRVITRDLIISYVRKALRTRIWFSLSPYQRALLKALTLSRVYVVRSRVLKELITELLLIIERGTLKGKALWYGLVIALNMCKYLKSIVLNVETLLYLGINYLNNPPIFRPYG
ncbi:MAG: hypothetical protein QXH99_08145 [Sulfolobales archaeon]